MAAIEPKSKKDNARKEKKEQGKLARFFHRLGRFFSDLRAELKRVVWPDRKKLVSSTLIVLAICVAAGIFLWIVDTLLMGFLNTVGFYNPSGTTVPTPAPTTISTTVSTTTAATTAATTAGTTTAGTTAKP